jgi:hypothetical protein
MKRLNPNTGKLFKLGDVRDDKLVFKQYKKIKNKSGFFVEEWVNLKNFILGKSFSNAKSRAVKDNLPFNLTAEYLKSIKTDNCPVFNIPLTWDRIGKGYKNNNNAPSLDRIIPEYGYIIGNVVYISKLANEIKSSATEVELYAVADWLHKERKRVLNNVEPITAAPVPTRPDTKGKDDSQSGTIPTAGAGQDGDDIDHHSGTVQRQDVNHSPQASSPDGMGHGNKQVATSQQLNLLEGIGQ